MGTGAEICARAMSNAEKSFYTTINPLPVKSIMAMKKSNAKIGMPGSTMAYDAFGDAYMFMGKTVLPKPDEMQYANRFIEMSKVLLEEGLLKPIHISVNSTGSGLEGALRGLDELRAGRVSGTKLVYTL